MAIDTTEQKFESDIVAVLTSPPGPTADPNAAPELAPAPGGYRARTSAEYDRDRCMLPKDVIDFVLGTQPEMWTRFTKAVPDDPQGAFLARLARAVKKDGTIKVLRNGLRSNGTHFRLAYFRPETGLNDDLQRTYAGNIFSVVRQLRYSKANGNELDLALFLNGLPLFTAELKNDFTGQTWSNAVYQYSHDRDPDEELFAFGRCLAHFAVDPNEVHFTTHLRGEKTRFFPFNRGYEGGAGNPPSATSYATSYLWRETWARDSVLDLVQRFVHPVDVLDDDGEPTGKRALVFPRYHQLDAVRRLTDDARRHGPGRQYLVQHSAGSGKSFTIAWLAHRLTSLHDAQDRRVFDAVIVVTDRRVLDKQLGQTVGQLEQVQGLIETVSTGKELAKAIKDGKQIVVTTIQKFPVISDSVQADSVRRFAVLVDEAHSSQSGNLKGHLNAVLEAGSLSEAESLDADDPADALDDALTREMSKRGRLPNVSTFAFTATPKPKTRELFGTKDAEGRFHPFSLYSMRQAIDEGFIEDVLQHYITYEHHFALLKKVEEDPRFDKAEAANLLVRYVSEHPTTIAAKCRVIVAHFADTVAPMVGGRAKAMVVTRSRLHAVRTAIELRKQLAEATPAGAKPPGVLVAFSGTVRDALDGGTKDYTETGLNGFPETQTARTFARPEHRILVVANKYQTGFDEPLLAAMYVDKQLGGVGAVQTLSRLNRMHPDKKSTIVLDFANEPGAIQKAFQPFYDRSTLTGGTDPNVLYDLLEDLGEAGFYTRDEMRAVAAEWLNPKGTQEKLHALLGPALDRYRAASDKDQDAFRKLLNRYVRLFGFLSQITSFTDIDLEALYTFGRLLYLKLPVERTELPLEVLKLADVDRSALVETSKGSIKLKAEPTDVHPDQGTGAGSADPEDDEALSVIIRTLNERFGAGLTEKDKVFIQQLQTSLSQSEAVRTSIKVNPPAEARLTFDTIADDEVNNIIEDNFALYKRIVNNPDFRSVLLDYLFRQQVEQGDSALEA